MAEGTVSASRMSVALCEERGTLWEGRKRLKCAAQLIGLEIIETACVRASMAHYDPQCRGR